MNLEVFKKAVDESRDGVVVCDAKNHSDHPVIFANKAFELMTGYLAEEVIGRNLRFLQRKPLKAAEPSSNEEPNNTSFENTSSTHQQTVLEDEETKSYIGKFELKRLSKTIAIGGSCLVTLKNYKKDGSLIWNELSISSLYDDAGTLCYFIGIQKDVTAKRIMEDTLREQNRLANETIREMKKLAFTDGLTKIYNRRYFDSQFETYWNIGLRNRQSLALFFIDIDDFKLFNDLYGHAQGDNVLVMVSNALSQCFQRNSDFIARYGGEEFVILSLGLSQQQAHTFSQNLLHSVESLKANPNDDNSENLGISISIGYGVIGGREFGDKTRSEFIKRVDDCLHSAKQDGKGRAVYLQSTLDMVAKDTPRKNL